MTTRPSLRDINDRLGPHDDSNDPGFELRERITAIDRILLSGADSVTVDGVSTKIDRKGLESERKRLAERYDRLYGRRHKPTVATINISGAF